MPNGGLFCMGADSAGPAVTQSPSNADSAQTGARGVVCCQDPRMDVGGMYK